MAYSFDGAFSNVNSAIGDIGKKWQDRQATEALLQAFDQSQGITPQPQAPTGLAALGQAIFGRNPVPTPRGLVPLGDNAPSPAPASLIQNESGGNWQAQNSAVGAGGAVGHFGRLQFGQARLQEAQAAGAIPAGTTPQAFMASPELQQRAERWHFSDIDQSIQQNGFDKLVGQSINGVPVTIDGMRAVAHLGGKKGLERFIRSGGRYNPQDENGTRLSDYFARHGGNGSLPQVQVAENEADVARLEAQMPGYGGMQVAQADAPAPGAAPAQGFAVPGAAPATRQNTNAQMIRSLIANPSTRAAGLQLWQQMATGRNFGFQVVGDQLYRTDPRTGTVEPVGVSKPVSPVTVSEGQSLVDPRTGQIVYQGQPKERAPVSVSEGGTLVNPQTGEVVYQGQVGNKARQEIATREQIADQQGYTGDDRKFYIANGRLPAANEKTTEGQANAALYADRMKEAEAILSQPGIAEAGMSRTQRGLSMLPGGNSLVSSEFQRVDQAQRNFINATLRRESGAVISEQEFDNARKQYFPQPGDSKEVIAQKARNRQTAIQGIANAAGPSYAKRQQQPAQQQFREGQRASNGQQVIVYRNGQWVPEQ